MLFRSEVDRPVNLRVAAAEFGWDPEDLRAVLLQQHDGKGPPDTRLNMLAIDEYVPRKTWEANTAGRLALWLDLVAPKREGIKEALAPQILDDAIKRFGTKVTK